jgi:plasmid maintenance system antidote protein VapI
MRTMPQFWLNLENVYNLGRMRVKRTIKPLIRVA